MSAQIPKTLAAANDAAVARVVKSYASWRNLGRDHKEALANAMANSTFGPALRDEAVSRICALTFTHTVRTEQDFEALGLSFHTQACLSDKTHFVYPHKGLPGAIERGQFEGKLTLDSLGNYVNFQ